MIPPWLTLRLAAYGAAAAALAIGLWLAYGWAYDRGVEAERDLTDARRAATRKRERLTDAIQTDPAAADWSRGRIPDGVRDAIADRRGLPGDP